MKKSIKPLVLAALLAASSGAAYATGDGGDNGMTAHYGDSWANLQAHDPDASTVPSLAAQDDAADARAAWDRARERVHTNMQTMRDRTSNAFHRMTGTSTNAANGTANTTSGSYGTTGTTGTTGTANTTSGAYGTSGATTGTASGTTGTTGSSMGTGTR